MSRLSEMEIFAAVVEEGGFTRAAQRLGVSKSSVSKNITALESRLGTRLLDRTTRVVNPTEIGRAYYERASRILDDAGEADAFVAELHSRPAGALRVSAPRDFGAHVVAPLARDFLGTYPEVSVTLDLCDEDTDLISGGFDLGLRIGLQKDSSLLSRKLATVEMRLLASPAYLARHGHPRTVADLRQHHLLSRLTGQAGQIWRFQVPEGEVRVSPERGRFKINDGKALLEAVESGVGLALLPDYMFAEAMAAGRVVDALPALSPDIRPIQAVFPAGRQAQPKVRAFMDHLADRLGAGFNAVGPRLAAADSRSAGNGPRN